VGTSATIGASSSFAGSILADQSITLNNAAVVSGRVLALNGAVTMVANIVAIPEPASFWLLALGASALGVRQRLSKAGRS